VDRYLGACAAALAGYGRGDWARLRPADRARWRQRAREWLRAEITGWAAVLDRGPQADRIRIRDQLAHLWFDPDLACLLNERSCDELSPAERKEDRALRDEIDVLIRRAQGIG
jgi:hypothetical protein